MHYITTVALFAFWICTCVKCQKFDWDCSNEDKVTVLEIWDSAWNKGGGRRSPFAQAVFQRLFEIEPDTKHVFTNKKIEIDEFTNAKLKMKYVLIVNGFDLIVNSAYSPETLEHHLRHYGETHTYLEGMEPEYLNLFTQAFVDILSQGLIDFNPGAWRRCFNGWNIKIADAMMKGR